jgi:hypothetical protein
MTSANDVNHINELDEIIGEPEDSRSGFIPQGYVPPTQVNQITLDTVFSSLHAGIADFKKGAFFSTFFGFAYFAMGLLAGHLRAGDRILFADLPADRRLPADRTDRGHRPL